MCNLDLSSLRPELRETVASIAQIVRSAGGRAYMVGGAVRDLVLSSREVKDVDVEVFGISADKLRALIGERFDYDTCGESFGVMKLKHIDIDVSLPRRESKVAEGHKGFEIGTDPFMSVEEAARRRDFTINAMYFDPVTSEFTDPYGGLSDLKNHILRHVSDRFAEDPLRVLRGMQFAARFGMAAAPSTLSLCQSMTMENLPPERLFEEWVKFILKGVDMTKGLAFLRDTQWVRNFPELAALIGCKQDPEWHPEGDVWNHTCLCLEHFAKNRVGDRDEDLIVGLAVLCHDFGKPATTRWDPRKGRLRSLGHDIAGVEPTLSFLRRLTNEEMILKSVPPLVQYHMQPFAMWRSKATDSSVRRLALNVGRIDRLVRVAAADDSGRFKQACAKKSESLEWLVAKAESLRLADSAPKPILLGRHLIEMGLKPGPSFGPILKACFEAQLDGAFADLDGAIKFATDFKTASATL